MKESHPTEMKMRPSRDTIPLLLIVLGSPAFYYPLLWGDQMLFFRDLTFLNYPMKFVLWEALQEGNLPFWNRALFSGTPFMADYQAGVFYPPSLLFFLDDFPTAFNLFYAGHYILLALSVFFLARSWKLSASASLCTTATTFLGGYFLSIGFTLPIMESAVWFPSILYFSQKYYSQPRTRFFLAALFCLTCQALAGSAENSVMTVLILFAFTVFHVPEKSGPSLRRLIPCTFLILGALGLSAVQLVPTYFLTAESVRQSGLTFFEHAHWSLHPQTLLTFLFPPDLNQVMGAERLEFSTLFPNIYMGLFAFFSLVASIFLLKDRGVRFWAAVAFAGLFLALGKHNPMYPFLYEWFPPVRLFRYPEKFMFLTGFSLAFLTGHVADHLLRSERSQNPKSDPVLKALALLILVLLGLTLFMGQPVYPVIILLIIGGILSLFNFGLLGPGAIRILIPLIIAIDLASNNFPLVPTTAKKYFEDPPRLTQLIENDSELFRVYAGPPILTGAGAEEKAPQEFQGDITYDQTKNMLYPNLGVIFGIEYPDGVESLELKDHRLWRDVFYRSPPERKKRILQRSNVKFRVRSENILKGSDPVLNPPSKNVEVLENVLPRAFLAGEMRQGRDPHLLNMYYEEGFDPGKTVLMDERLTLKWNPKPDFQGIVEAISYDHSDRVSLHTRQNGDGFLVLMDSYFPGWKVTIDGRPGQILRGNHFYRAVLLGPGAHHVEFRFHPRGLREGMTIGIFTLIILFAVGLRLKILKRKKVFAEDPRGNL